MKRSLTLWLDGERAVLHGQRGDLEEKPAQTQRIGGEKELAEALATLFAADPNVTGGAVLVLGYPCAHVREIPTVPFDATESDVRAAIELGANRFLRQRPEGRVILGIWKGRCSWIVADCDARLLEVTTKAAADAGVSIRIVVTEISVRAFEARNGSVELITGRARADIEALDAVPIAVKTSFATMPATSAPTFHLAELAARSLAGSFAPGGAQRIARAKRRRNVILVLISAVAVVLGMFAPGIVSSIVVAIAEHERVVESDARMNAATDPALLQAYQLSASAIAEFERSALASRLDIGSIAANLPEGSALLTLNVDSAALRLVVLAPRGFGMFPGVELDSSWSPATLLGPIIREQLEGREFERVALELRPRSRPASPND